MPVLFLHFCALPTEITCRWSINAAWLSCWILSELVLVSVIQVWVRLSLIFLKIIWYHLALFVADDNNTRVLFEKVLSSMPKDKARFVVDNLNYLVNFLWVGCGTELGFCKTVTCSCFENPVYFCSDVWGKFLEFETTSGDLASLVKVENRKLEIYKEVRCLVFYWSFTHQQANVSLAFLFP